MFWVAIFKQITLYKDNRVRIQQCRLALKAWNDVQWADLDVETQRLIQSINEGKTDVYCVNCQSVLNPKSDKEFCSKHCESQFCRCGTRFSVRQETDAGPCVNWPPFYHSNLRSTA